jgi:hypothetical protein
MGRPGPLGIRLAVTVQPGCTNLGLGTLLHSRTNADDDGRMGCSQARAQAESKSSMASVCAHTYTRRTYGEYQKPWCAAIFYDHLAPAPFQYRLAIVKSTAPTLGTGVARFSRRL